MHLIACEVFRPELERLTRAMRNAPEGDRFFEKFQNKEGEIGRKTRENECRSRPAVQVYF